MLNKSKKKYILNCENNDNIVQPYLKLIISIASRYFPFVDPSEKDDLIQVGIIGFLHGVSKYKPEKKASLGSYTKKWIQVFINVYMKKKAFIKLPNTEKYKLLFKKKKELIKAFEDNDTALLDNLKKESDTTDLELIQMYYWLKKNMIISTIKLNDNNNEEIDILDTITIDNTEENLLKGDQERYYKEIFKQALETLSPKERNIFYRLNLKEDKDTFADVGKDYGFSKQCVHQLNTKLERKIYHYIKHRYVWNKDLDQVEARKK